MSCVFPFNVWLLTVVVKVTHSLCFLPFNNLSKCLTHLLSVSCLLLINDPSSCLHILGYLHTYLPMKMEQTECSETSAYKIQMPGNYPEESIQQWYDLMLDHQVTSMYSYRNIYMGRMLILWSCSVILQTVSAGILCHSWDCEDCICQLWENRLLPYPPAHESQWEQFLCDFLGICHRVFLGHKKSIFFFIVRCLCEHRALNYTSIKKFSPHSRSANARDKTSKIYNYLLGSFRN